MAPGVGDPHHGHQHAGVFSGRQLVADHPPAVREPKPPELPEPRRRSVFRLGGAPIGFFIEEDEIHFVPTPDGVYSIEHVYLKDEAELSGDTDEPSLPARYTDFLVAHALLLVSQMIRDEGLYGMADRERKMWLQRMADEARRSTSTVRIKTRNDLGI